MGGQWRGAKILNIKQNRYYSMLQLIYAVCYTYTYIQHVTAHIYAHTQRQKTTKQVEGANGHRDSYFGMVSITSPFCHIHV